jgi:hypothetical protein
MLCVSVITYPVAADMQTIMYMWELVGVEKRVPSDGPSAILA